MKTYIIENPGQPEDYAEIHCACQTQEILNLASWMESRSIYFFGKQEGREKRISADGIYYVESVNKKTFLYTEDAVWESPLSLREIEVQTEPFGFVRISKSFVVNLYYVEEIQNDFEMRMRLLLENKERLIVNRHYRKLVRAGIENLKHRIAGKSYAVD